MHTWTVFMVPSASWSRSRSEKMCFSLPLRSVKAFRSCLKTMAKGGMCACKVTTQVLRTAGIEPSFREWRTFACMHHHQFGGGYGITASDRPLIHVPRPR